MRHRLYQILNQNRSGDSFARNLNGFLAGLISLNVAAVIFETVPTVNQEFGNAFLIFEIFSVTVFTLEYFIRLWVAPENPNFRGSVTGRLRYALTRMALVDLISILPFYLPIVVTLDLRILRTLRLFRLLRVFKMERYGKSLQILTKVLKEKRAELYVTLFATCILLVIASTLMYFIENQAQPDRFSSIPASMWWGIITLTTVGYGDVYPVTVLGKIVGTIIALLGIGLFALPAGILGSGFVAEVQKTEAEELRCPRCGEKLVR